MFSLDYQILDTSRANPLLSQKEEKEKKIRQTELEAVLTSQMFFIFFFM